jgi:hypothetical protein
VIRRADGDFGGSAVVVLAESRVWLQAFIHFLPSSFLILPLNQTGMSLFAAVQ